MINRISNEAEWESQLNPAVRNRLKVSPPPGFLPHFPITVFPQLTEENPVHFEERTDAFSPLHDHEFYEIAIVMEGTALHIAEGLVTPVKRGDVFVIPIGRRHAWLDAQDAKCLNIYYQPGRLVSIMEASGARAWLRSLFFSSDFFQNPSMQSVIHFRIADPAVEAVRLELNEMRNTRAQGLDLDSTYYVGCFLKILSRLAVEYTLHLDFRPATQIVSPKTYRLLETLDKMAASGEQPSISDYAVTLGISSEHLIRLFTKEIGIPPFKYFNKRRLKYSRTLLLNNSLSITDIAFRFGFSDSAHFSRVFKEHFGVSPSEIRRHCQTTEG